MAEPGTPEGPSGDPPAAASGRDLSFWVLVVVGGWLVLTPFVPPLRQALDERIGAVSALELILGFCLFYVAFLVRDLGRMRQRNLVVLETLQSLVQRLRAEGFLRGEQEAVDILVSALRGRSERARSAALQELRRLTGQDFGEDVGAWETWWEENRVGFRVARPPAPPPRQDPPGG